jgi:hypothetical protein
MGGTSPLLFMLLLLIAFQVYSTYDANKKIWCIFRREDKTKVAKWAKPNQAVIDFDGGWYQVEARRITTMIKIVGFMPTIIKSLDFTHDSTRALDPDTFTASMSPEERKQLDKRDDIKALETGNQQALKSGGAVRLGGLQQYMPLVTIVGFIIVGYFIYMLMGRIDQLGFAMNVIQIDLAKIMQNGGIK